MGGLRHLWSRLGPWGRLETAGDDWGRLGTAGDDWGRLRMTGDDWGRRLVMTGDGRECWGPLGMVGDGREMM